jgi:hypothetical protein
MSITPLLPQMGHYVRRVSEVGDDLAEVDVLIDLSSWA